MHLLVLSKLSSEYKLAVVGDGNGRVTVEQAASEHSVENCMETCGKLLHKEVPATISAADALVLSSHTESYLMVVFEALALNTEVFATHVEILPTIDHSRPHISSLDEIPQLISETAIESTDGVDTESLERFSMERYTDGLLDAFIERTNRETSGGS